jgi:hypothetical protein
VTSQLNYPHEVAESSDHAQKNPHDSSYLPPDYTERRDVLGRHIRPAIEGDGRVRARPTHRIAKQRLKALRIERALENEELNAALVDVLNLPNRRERVTATAPAICKTVIDYFKWSGVTISDLRDTVRQRDQGIVSYVRLIVWEMAARHCRMSVSRFCEWFGGCDHSSVSYARAKVRATIVLDNIEGRALRADLNAITVMLAEQFNWADDMKSTDARADLIARLLLHAKKIEDTEPRASLDIIDLCSIVQRECS